MGTEMSTWLSLHTDMPNRKPEPIVALGIFMPDPGGWGLVLCKLSNFYQMPVKARPLTKAEKDSVLAGWHSPCPRQKQEGMNQACGTTAATATHRPGFDLQQAGRHCL